MSGRCGRRFDSGFEGRANVKGRNKAQIDVERTSHAAANRAVLRYFGRTEKDFPSAIVADEVAVFEDHLESFLLANWPEWDAACKVIEAAAGINLAKNRLAYRTATLRADGVVPEVLQQILAKAEGN